MNTLSQTLRRNAYGLAAAVVAVTLALPSAFVTQVGAAQLQARSIKMSSSSPGATGVSYEVKFTTSASMQSLVIEFCDKASGPLVGESCVHPTGMVTGGLTLTGSGTWSQSGSTNGIVQLSNSASQAAGTQTLTLDGVTNPTGTPDTFYARITTYSGSTNNYTSATNVGTIVDQGGVALSTTNDIAVTAAVLEQLTFCVSAAQPTANCGGVTTPSLQLGEGTPKALSTTAVSTGVAYFQLSTNASGNTTVRLTNGATGGGLSSGTDQIPAVDSGAGAAAIVAGTPDFGVRVDSVAGGSGGNLTLDSLYTGTNTQYNMLTDATDTGNGVDSVYGSQLATSSGPVSSRNASLTFGATINNLTPAGIYAADLSLIATSSY